ncbi:hypothetical protein LJC31_01000 [Synergistaceae bacterium OttesenSCG-928-I11]|nr:hypothetical protein [Synergistaceae bacterium OttesenSCG-928-I11]
MAQIEEKIWIVVELKDDGGMQASAFDNEADAKNYFIEMRARYTDTARIRIQETVLNRREEYIPSDESPWGALRVDVTSELVEGLMEDMVPLDQIKPDAAHRFVCEKVEMVRRRTLDRIDEIIRKETREELLACHDDWCHGKHMED